ncbi:hypothetical protein EYF80_048746 [Liparis tanakae]|uniref:Uncharacterized protein n=1 Tax=Liparis tanakae TaxID=230148 RepID=A0A4Z2FLD3_9TELE|nr:hypothetical protein EYF80_048746 [Liparis tanakae]
MKSRSLTRTRTKTRFQVSFPDSPPAPRTSRAAHATLTHRKTALSPPYTHRASSLRKRRTEVRAAARRRVVPRASGRHSHSSVHVRAVRLSHFEEHLGDERETRNRVNTKHVDEAEREELQADGEAVEQPVERGRQVVGLQSVAEVEGEQGGADGGPEQAEEQEDALVAPPLVSVEVEEPELRVHHQEQSAVQGGVEGGEAQLDRRGDGRMEGDRDRRGGGVGRRRRGRRGGCDRSFH